MERRGRPRRSGRRAGASPRRTRARWPPSRPFPWSVETAASVACRSSPTHGRETTARTSKPAMPAGAMVCLADPPNGGQDCPNGHHRMARKTGQVGPVAPPRYRAPTGAPRRPVWETSPPAGRPLPAASAVPPRCRPAGRRCVPAPMRPPAATPTPSARRTVTRSTGFSESRITTWITKGAGRSPPPVTTAAPASSGDPIRCWSAKRSPASLIQPGGDRRERFQRLPGGPHEGVHPERGEVIHHYGDHRSRCVRLIEARVW